MSSRTDLHVAVVKGGRSVERQVSLVSGRECAAALRRVGYKVSEVDAGNDLPKELGRLSPDIIFNALHGRYGEDGCVQGLFEWLELPYTHSGVQASALAMNKDIAKRIFKSDNLPVAESICASSAVAFSTHLMEPPYVIKPVNEGSSVGVHLVMQDDDNFSTLEKNFPDQVLVEKFIPGRELTTTIMDGLPLGVTDIISVSAVGSLKEKLKPGKFVIVDQFIDRTFARIKTFFDDEIVAHVSMAHPTSNGLMLSLIHI